MKRILLLMMIGLIIFPCQAFAYSYGDPTKEDIAETYKLIKGKLDAGTPDWNGALEAYKVRRSEISSHFGESITVTLDQNFKAKSKDVLLANYRYVLYLNIDRRFTYTEKDINDYSKAKILVAKAKGTFDVLRPFVQSKIPGKIAGIDAAYEKALQALGNPGLFGVGEEPVQPEEFKKQASFILSTLKPLFNYTPAKKEAAEPAPAPAADTKQTSKAATTTNAPKQETTTEKSSAETKSTTETKNTAEITSTKEVKAKETTSKPEKADTETSTTAEKATKEQTDTASKKEAALENNETVAAETEVNKEKENSEISETNEAPPAEDVSDNGETVNAAKESEELTQEVAAAHAPMDRSDKTNPIVTVVVIIGVVIVGIGGIYFAKKKQFI